MKLLALKKNRSVTEELAFKYISSILNEHFREALEKPESFDDPYKRELYSL